MKQYGDFLFSEHVRDIAVAYVTYKRSLGFKCSYHDQASINSMLKYIYTNSTVTPNWVLTPEVVHSYVIGSGMERPRTIHAKQSLIRQFGLYMKLQGSDAYVFPRELVKLRKISPHIYSPRTRLDQSFILLIESVPIETSS